VIGAIPALVYRFAAQLAINAAPLPAG